MFFSYTLDDSLIFPEALKICFWLSYKMFCETFNMPSRNFFKLSLRIEITFIQEDTNFAFFERIYFNAEIFR